MYLDGDTLDARLPPAVASTEAERNLRRRKEEAQRKIKQALAGGASKKEAAHLAAQDIRGALRARAQVEAERENGPGLA
jgi:hypothetical protein